MKKTDELLLKLMLTLARDRQAMQGRVRSVGFIREYLTLPQHLGVHTLSHMSEQQIEELAASVSVKVKSDAAHFHFYLNDSRYYLLQVVDNRIPLKTSMTEKSWVMYEEQAGVKYGTLAFSSNAKEQIIPLSKLDSGYMNALLSYMLFQGTEHGPSMHQAEGLFIFEEALNMNSWTVMTKEQAISHALKHGYIEVSNESISIYMTI